MNEQKLDSTRGHWAVTVALNQRRSAEWGAMDIPAAGSSNGNWSLPVLAPSASILRGHVASQQSGDFVPPGGMIWCARGRHAGQRLASGVPGMNTSLPRTSAVLYLGLCCGVRTY